MCATREPQLRKWKCRSEQACGNATVDTLLFAYLGESMILFAYLRMQKQSLGILLNSRLLFQNCIFMIFGALSCVLVSYRYLLHYCGKHVEETMTR
ncbi:MAG: YibE/F family protein [Eubacterium sp.]